MLKRIALVGMFLFAFAFAGAAGATHRPLIKAPPAPTAPQPQGFCWPAGMPC